LIESFCKVFFEN